jgi:hypothetical protein
VEVAAPKEMWEVKVFVGNEIQTYPFEMPSTGQSATGGPSENAPQASAGGLLETFGWKLPWATQKPASGGAKSATTQAL